MSEIKTPEEVLDKYGRAWFSEEVEMEDEMSHVEYPKVIQAMGEYASQFKQQANEPTTSNEPA